MSTVITYNGVQIFGCLTERFEQEVAYDDTHTDKIFDRFTIRVSGMVVGAPNQSFYATHTSNPDNASASVSHRNIRYLLTQPRKQFEMKMNADLQGNGGQTILKCGPMGASGTTATEVDMDNGPKPHVLNIDHVAGDTAFRVLFEIVICKQECDPQGNAFNTSGVLNNRWNCVDDIDANWNTTRTFQGRLRTASAQINPHSFRYLVMPPLAGGMRRDRMTFNASADGLVLDYTIVDKEIHYSAPAPAHTWNMTHTETGGEGLIAHGECTVRLEGDRMVDKKALIALGVNICVAKLGVNLQAAQNNSNFLIEGYQFSDIYGDESAVEINLQIKRQNGNQAQAFNVQIGTMGQPYGLNPADLANGQTYDYRISADPGPAGPISITKAMIARLQFMCEADHSYDTLTNPINDDEEETDTETDDGTTIQVDTTLDPDNTPDPTVFSADSIEAIYLSFVIESRYNTTPIRAQCPIASAPSGSSDDTSKTVTMARPIANRVFRLSASRLGQSPVIPSPSDSFVDENNITYTLLENKLLLAGNELTADLKSAYRVECQYTYAMSRSPTTEDQLRSGTNSWSTSSYPNRYPLELFSGQSA